MAKNRANSLTSNERIEEQVEAFGVRVTTKLYDLIGRSGFEEFQQVAKKIGVSKSQISKWLNGDHNFELRTLVRLASAFDLTPRIEFLPEDITKNLYSSDEQVYWTTTSTVASTSMQSTSALSEAGSELTFYCEVGTGTQEHALQSIGFEHVRSNVTWPTPAGHKLFCSEEQGLKRAK